MGLRDRVAGLGLGLVGAFGEALTDWADLSKGRPPSPGESNADEGPESSTGGTAEDTATSSPVPQDKSNVDPKSLFWDPFALVEQLGYKERSTSISYGTLKAMVWRMPIIQAIIQTRIKQVAAFTRPQKDRYQMGFRLALRDSSKEPTKQDRIWIQQMQSLIMRTGVTDNPRGRDNFEEFITKLCWDSLVYDQCGFEIVPNRKGLPAEWYAVDAATLRLADSASTFVDEDDTKASRYVQIYDGMVIAEFTQEELGFGVRNPRSELRQYGYGTSELEMLVSTVTSLLWGWEYNQRAFSQGSAAKGILNFKGTVPEGMLKQFRRQWYQMLSGVQNAWRTPITNAEGLEWVSLQANNRDMEYNAWMDFLIKVACSIFTIDPIEVNFKYGNEGQKGGLNEASNRDKITESKERGLRPLLRFFSTLMNQHLIWPINEAFEFEFVGLDAMTHDDIANLNAKRVKTFITVNELRAEEDRPPIEGGDIILDPTYLQFLQGQQAQAQGLNPDGSDPNADANPFGDDDEKSGNEPDDDSAELQRLLAGDDDDSEDGDDESPPDRARKSMAAPSNALQGHSRKILLDIEV